MTLPHCPVVLAPFRRDSTPFGTTARNAGAKSFPHTCLTSQLVASGTVAGGTLSYRPEGEQAIGTRAMVFTLAVHQTCWSRTGRWREMELSPERISDGGLLPWARHHRPYSKGD